MKRLFIFGAVAIAVFVASASAGTVLYDPPPESGTTSYNAAPVDVPFTVDPPQSCTNPEPASGTVGGVDVTLDQPQVCVDPPPVSGTTSYDAPAVDVPFTFDPAPRNVTFPDQVAADCGDGLDNDNDTFVDMADGGCASTSDTLEAPNPACSDGIDNDGDGLTDFPADPGCRDIRDTGEFNSAPPPPAAQCADTLDNDGDGLIDLADPGCTDAADNDETNAPPPPPPPGGDDLILPENTTFRCEGPVNYDRVVVRITQQTQRQDAVFLSSGCSGTIQSLEVDSWASDGIHIGPGAGGPAGLRINGGHVHLHDTCSVCGSVHLDGIQVLGGSNITFRNFLVVIDPEEGTNSAVYINQGSGAQETPTDVVFENSTFVRSPNRNRTFRIGDSIRSGLRNSTVYWCGTAANCGGGDAIAFTANGDPPVDPVNENNATPLRSTWQG